MHVAGVNLDLNWFLQFIFTAFIIAFGLLHFVKNTASKYFEVDANFEGGDHSDRTQMPGALMEDPVCAVCGNSGPKKCSRCKAVRYCSQKCQEKHWKSGHKTECKNTLSNSRFKTSSGGGKTFSGLALVPIRGISKHIKKPKEILFPYDEFVQLFNWDKLGFPPCGLLNCGNSCFANVVLQCLSSTRPLVAYLLEKGHRRECICEDWCFLCEFQTHLERASQSSQAFSPTNIISRLPNIGGNLVHGRQEDAHELMRFAIDTMQSVCLSEFGGEKAVHPSTQETTIIQHIFGGLLQSQVICTKCKNISNRYDNMMDLTVEIHGDASSLEECLDQFTIKEWLDGENKYKCDGCNDYVKAWKRLTVKRAPNILTIALKRFQSGRFGKINKRVTFPETLDLNPYMSETGDGANIYKLYAVVVHVDMLNASFFGHYICYTKDFGGNWYRIDDCKVATVNLEEVLSQGAYMLLYSRVQPRASCLTLEPPRKTEEMIDVEVQPCRKEQVECSTVEPADSTCHSGFVPSDTSLPPQISSCVEDSSAVIIPEAVRERSDNADLSLKSPSSVPKEVCIVENNTLSSMSSPSVSREREISSCEKVPAGKLDLDTVRGDPVVIAIPNGESCRPVLDDVSARCEKYLSSSGGEYVNGNSEDMDIDNCQSGSSVAEDIGICKNNGPTYADGITSPVAHSGFLNGNGVCRVEKVDKG
ncbi:PREDICTED: ubiquitin [Prunus dulcis]|uniref:ubiquitinyl hydrolase 1 n=1 Tax=Prunus dulcis TaxID=3755 RepID=A0A5E4E9U3_PRUDU|nr:ubiquitin carboxyl-terminal hydrolase 18-like isoform X2 [Prunus dulcis]VVA11679.1 PREDICTED: ubiquitin [Prunus dulcis]